MSDNDDKVRSYTLKRRRLCERCDQGFLVGLNSEAITLDDRIIACPECSDDGEMYVTRDESVDYEDIRPEAKGDE